MPQISAVLNGKLSFVTALEDFGQPMELPGTWTLVFDAQRRVVDAASLPPLRTPPFQVKKGPLKFENVVTVRLASDDDALPVAPLKHNGVGSFDPLGGDIKLPLQLLFMHKLPFVARSVLTIELSSRTTSTLALPQPAGHALVKPGNQDELTLRLVANGRFFGGELKDVPCALAIDGVLDRSPF